jgi:NitT/TauT family transport system substrate-binding protein
MARTFSPALKATIAIAVAVIAIGSYVMAKKSGKLDQVTASLAPEGRKPGSIRKVANGGKDPVTVCVVTWGGYAGGQYFNGGFEPSTDSRYYKDYGITVAFKAIEDFEPSRAAWKSDECQMIWQTADAFPTEAGSLADHDPKIVMQADWSRGGDVAVALKNIKSFSDLRGKKIAVAAGTPSHSFLLWALQSAGLDYTDVTIVTTESAPAAAALFKAGKVDAAIVWSPDDEDIIQNVRGSHVLTSTKQASNIIADVFFVKGKYLEDNRDKVCAVVEGWLRGSAEINSDPKAKEDAVKILSTGLNQPEDFIRKAINNTRLATYGDNVNFFNLKGGYTGVTGQELYEKTGRLYQQIGMINSMPSWRSVMDPTCIKSIQSLNSVADAAEEGPRFAKASEEDKTAEAFATKRLTITFPTGSSELDDNSKTLIDVGFADIARNFRDARIRVEGNTDDVGTDAVNQPLSERRARAVADYLASTYGFPRERFVVVGNGSRNPADRSGTNEARRKNRRTEFQLLNQ